MRAITRLPKQTYDTPPWQNAMHVLIQAAEYDGPIEFACLGMLQALFPKGTPSIILSTKIRSGATAICPWGKMNLSDQELTHTAA